jgi:three-Cys-motif partner protein
MSKVIETVWDIEPHTAKKHEILRRYFQAWLPILGRFNSRLLYIDAFAGPGEYSKGEDGSPLVVLKAARDHTVKFTSELECIFVESTHERFCHLVKLLDRIKPSLRPNIRFRALEGTFNDQLAQIFGAAEEQRKRRGPTLAFVDPFGYSHTPFDTIAKLIRYPKSEVLINFMYEEINRFLPVPSQTRHFDAQFGTPKWREVVEMSDPDQRLMAIHDLYLNQLEHEAKYVRGFLMRNKSNTPDYFLFFATNSLDGLEAMKYAMWKADPSGEFCFSDYTDSKKQPLLFSIEPDYAWLREILTEKFGRIQIEIEALGDWVVINTLFLRTHIKKPVLIPMEKEGAISIVDPKAGRRPYTYPDGTIIKFH